MISLLTVNTGIVDASCLSAADLLILHVSYYHAIPSFYQLALNDVGSICLTKQVVKVVSMKRSCGFLSWFLEAESYANRYFNV